MRDEDTPGAPDAVLETLLASGDAPAPRPRAKAELPVVERASYQIDGELARGGMGRIVRAVDQRIGRPVAIKEALSAEPAYLERFEREAVITARLQHPSIVPVYEAGRWPEGDPFYAMKLVAGRPLGEVIDDTRTVAERIALLPHVIGVCEALAYAHDRGIVHRDLKPGNVLVGDYGETVVIDWGLAKDLARPEVAGGADGAASSGGLDLTRVGSAMGTPAYMSPEQARGELVDARSDVYALGAILYHALCGAMPYQGASSASEILERLLAGPPPPLAERAAEVPRELVAIVARAMARDAEARYPSARELAADLRRFQAGQLVSVHDYSTIEIVGRWVRRHAAAVATAVVLLGVLIVVAVISVRQVLRARDLAKARRAEALEEQGREELAAGSPARALPYLIEAWRAGRRSPTLTLMLAEAAPAVTDVAASWQAADAPIAALAADGGGVIAADATGAVTGWTADGAARAAPAEAPAPPAFSDYDRLETLDEPELHAVGAWQLELRVVHAEDGKLDDAHRRIRATGPDGRVVSADWIGAQLRGAAVTDGWIAAWEKARVILFRPDGEPSAQVSYPAGIDAVAGFAIDARPTVAVLSGGAVQLHDADSGVVIGRLEGHGGAVTALAGGGDRLYTGGEDGRIVAWAPAPRIVLGAPPGAVGASPEGDRLAVVDGPRLELRGADGEATTIDVGGGVRAAAIAWADGRIAIADDAGAVVIAGLDGRIVGGIPSTAQQVSIDPTGRRIATLEASRVRIWSLDGAPLATLDEHDDVVAAVAWLPDGAGLVSAGDDGAVWLWPGLGADGVTIDDGDGAVGAIAVAPHGGAIAFGASDGAVRVVDAATLEVRHELAGHGEPAAALAFAPDGGALATGGADGAIRIWRLPGGELVAEVAHGAPVAGLAFRDDGAILASGGRGDGEVRLWDARSGALLSRRAGGGAVAFVDGGRGLAVVGPGGAVVWRLGAALPAAALGGLEARGPWRLDAGRLMARHGSRRRPEPREVTTYDFSGDTFEGEIVRPLAIGDARPADPGERALAEAAALIERGEFADAVAVGGAVDGAAIARDDLLGVLAHLRDYAGDPDGALRWALAAADRAAPERRRDHLPSIVRFAAGARAPAGQVIAELERLAAPEPAPLLDLAEAYGGHGREADAGIALDRQVATGREVVPAQLSRARMAFAANRFDEMATAAIAALDAAAAEPARADDARDRALEWATVLGNEYRKRRDRRVGHAALRIHRRLRRDPSISGEAVAAGVAFAFLVLQTREQAPDLDKVSIRRPIKLHASEVVTCYERGLIADPALEGVVVVQFTIDALGRVDDAGAAPEDDAPAGLRAVADCIAARVATWRFGEGGLGSRIQVTYPFILRPAGT
jgi:hypothetical protein